MTVRVIDRGGTLVYQVVERGTTPPETLAAMYYQEIEGVFERAYPPQLLFPHDLSALEVRFNRYVACELQGERSIAAFETALEQVCDWHQEAGIDWWLAGSAALYIQGLDVMPHDIDVLTSLTQLGPLIPLVTPYVVEPFHHSAGWVVRGFGVIDPGYRVDYAFDPEPWVDQAGPVDFGPFAGAHTREITWHRRTIRVPPLELHLPGNRARGRDSVVAQIEARLRLGR